MYWLLPPVQGQKVILNPEGRYYQNYNQDQAKGDAGWIIGTTSISTLRGWASRGEDNKLETGVTVKWANGHSNSYNVKDLIPVHSDAKDLMKIETTGGVISGTKEEIDGRLDEIIIRRGAQIRDIVHYNDEYRNDIFGSVLHQYNKLMAQYGAKEEFVQAIELLHSLGVTEVEPKGMKKERPTPSRRRSGVDDVIEDLLQL